MQTNAQTKFQFGHRAPDQFDAARQEPRGGSREADQSGIQRGGSAEQQRPYRQQIDAEPDGRGHHREAIEDRDEDLSKAGEGHQLRVWMLVLAGPAAADAQERQEDSDDSPLDQEPAAIREREVRSG